MMIPIDLTGIENNQWIIQFINSLVLCKVNIFNPGAIENPGSY